MQEQRSQARAAVEARHPIKRDGSVNVSDPSEKPKRDTRAEFAREARLPERKLHAAA